MTFLRTAWMYCNETHQTHHGARDSDDIFKVKCKGQGHKYVFRRRHTDRRKPYRF